MLQLQRQLLGEATLRRHEMRSLFEPESMWLHLRGNGGHHPEQDDAASQSAQGSRWWNGLVNPAVNPMGSWSMVSSNGDFNGNAVSTSVQNGFVFVNGQPV